MSPSKIKRIDNKDDRNQQLRHQQEKPNRKKQRNTHNGNGNYNSSRPNNPKPKNDVTISKSLSWVLRHKAPSLGLGISSDGYVSINDLLSCNHPRFQSVTLEDILRVVKNDSKQRYTIKEQANQTNGEVKNELYIRANQGHSISNTIIQDKELLTPIDALSDLTGNDDDNESIAIVHGTFKKAWVNNICRDGLHKMNRNHIHFVSLDDESSNSNTIVHGAKAIPGLRRNCEVLIYVNTSMIWSKNKDTDVQFFKSDNNVLLTPGINKSGVLPCTYFSKVLDIASDENHPVLLYDGKEFTAHHNNLISEFSSDTKT